MNKQIFTKEDLPQYTNGYLARKFSCVYLVCEIHKKLAKYSNKTILSGYMYYQIIDQIEELIKIKKPLFFSYLYLTKDEKRFYTKIGWRGIKPKTDLNIVGVILTSPIKAIYIAHHLSRKIKHINLKRFNSNANENN